MNISALPAEREAEAWTVRLEAVARERDRQAYAELFRHFAPLLKSFALSSPGMSSNALAEELVQEIMPEIWNRASTFDAGKASATTWIYTLARNCRIDLLRKKFRHREVAAPPRDEQTESDAGPMSAATMTHYHPDQFLLNDYVAGSLPGAVALPIAVHLEYCAQCREEVAQLGRLGAELFSELDPVPVGDDAFARHHIRAGGKVLAHGHAGSEITVVLHGSFSDQDGRYAQGDFLVRGPGDEHRPVAAADSDCLCLAVLDAPIRLGGLLGRLANPFLRIHPR